MVKEIKIQNYKSVQDLTLELGRVNVLIGANGCGKSNILEAIAFGSAAADNKLDKEFLSARGIRVTEPEAMRSGFTKNYYRGNIKLFLKSTLDREYHLIIGNDGMPYSKWEAGNTLYAKKMGLSDFDEGYRKIISEELPEFDITNLENFSQEKLNYLRILLADVFKTRLDKNTNLLRFLIYAPENTFLRKFEDEERTDPLGIRGEGLFKLLSEMSQETHEEFQEIIENLELIDWFDGFEIPKDLVFTERRIRIKDRFLEEGLQYFDQRSSNEGFLFLMFYFALFISKYTPKFFAIDNIDASLNPKLCIELIKILTQLAKKHDKQVIFTTHNPAILDGLNLNDDEVRLLVVSRNKDGHTKTKRIKPTPVPEGEIPVRLSEQFMRGYIGGLPKNF
ncbi:putative ATPase [Arcicella aurantiaca]|uniref:Putative ATPase n=1 Tax=Arcicella aurantiaca TaxID=591202 RepID=A0A316ESU5_9BACT|nr:ATP-binding protein [Arcicella aurantiaca]PWK26230.1 putative ATPase [Arcicella aurantiaca]